MRHNRPRSRFPLDEATPTQPEIERAVVITHATMLIGPIGRLAEMSTHDIRAVVCARFGFDIGRKSHDYIRGAFDALTEQRQPLPRHDIIAR